MATKPASQDRQIVVGERAYTLRFSVRAMGALQDHYGLPSLDAVGKKLGKSAELGVQDMVVILWAGLRTHHPETTPDDAMGILDDLGLAGMQVALGGMIDSGTPAAPAGEGDADTGPR